MEGLVVAVGGPESCLWGLAAFEAWMCHEKDQEVSKVVLGLFPEHLHVP